MGSLHIRPHIIRLPTWGAFTSAPRYQFGYLHGEPSRPPAYAKSRLLSRLFRHRGLRFRRLHRHACPQATSERGPPQRNSAAFKLRFQLAQGRRRGEERSSPNQLIWSDGTRNRAHVRRDSRVRRPTQPVERQIVSGEARLIAAACDAIVSAGALKTRC